MDDCGNIFSDEINKIVEEVTETHEKFIFETIKPFCESVVEMEISKEDLTHALLLWQNYEKRLKDDMLAMLDKIRAEILEDCGYSKDYVGAFTYSTIKVANVLQILDKYKRG